MQLRYLYLGGTALHLKTERSLGPETKAAAGLVAGEEQQLEQ